MKIGVVILLLQKEWSCALNRHYPNLKWLIHTCQKAHLPKNELHRLSCHVLDKNLQIIFLTLQHSYWNLIPVCILLGNQLNLFSGPLYFLYKIISTINLTKELKTKYPTYNFVPIYWMATEDHDFEEINYFNFKGKKFRWNKESTGPVGRLSTDDLPCIFHLQK